MPLAQLNLTRMQRIERATAALPQTAQSALFTVRGGAILVHALVGRFTAAASATATNLTIVANPTTGADVNLSAALAIASLAVGHTVALGATVGAALGSNASGVVLVPTYGGAIMVPVGTIDALTSASNATARVEWMMLWTALDENAAVS